MFNKEGIPFFVITIPFLSIFFIALFSFSFYLKTVDASFEEELKSYKTLYMQTHPNENFDAIEKNKRAIHAQSIETFQTFMVTLTTVTLIFMFLFTILMMSIINDIVKKYVKQVQHKEEKLQNLNQNLVYKVQQGIEEGKKKDKAILMQAKHARMGSMISIIAHQWRQPLTELSGILMELETATRFNKVNKEHILNSVEKSDQMIAFMSNTIDDFRNFYKPDKKKEYFNLKQACESAISLITATLIENEIELKVEVHQNRDVFGYPREFSQVILNLISNAKDILIEKQTPHPFIELSISTKGLNSIICVKDNAGGIQPEFLELVFDPYFSTKDTSKGTGLGLYISKLIIERNMGGELSVYNDHEGAVFKIVLAG